MTRLILPIAGPKVFCISKGSPEVVFDTLCVPGKGTVSPAVQEKVGDGAKVKARRDIFFVLDPWNTAFPAVLHRL